MMKKTRILTLAVLAAFLIAGGWLWRSKNTSQGKEAGTNSNEGKIVIFVSTTCPHCHKVEEWLDSQAEIKKEVVLKTANKSKRIAEELMAKGEECGIDQRSRGAVPLLYDQGRCVLGDQPIIDYLKERSRQ